MLCTSCDFVQKYCTNYNLYDTKIQVMTYTILACKSYNLYKIKPKKWFNCIFY